MQAEGLVHTRRRGTSALFGVLSAVLCTLAVSSFSPAQELSGDTGNGKFIYEQRCQRCHGAGGWGDGPQAAQTVVPPSDFHAPAIRMKTDEQLRTSIEFGIVLSPMHAWRGTLSDQDVRDVVAYVRLLGQGGR